MNQILINDISEIEKLKNKLKNIKFFVGSPATGKSYLAQKHEDFYDWDLYYCNLKKIGVEDAEELSIQEAVNQMKKGKYITSAAHTFALNYLVENNIDFIYFYPKGELQDEYIERMRQRGSSEDFIKRFGLTLKERYESKNKEKYKIRVEMDSGLYISDYIGKILERNL